MEEMVNMRKSWKQLAIDTATKYVYLSLVIDSKEVDCIYEEGFNNHSVTVIPHLAEMLKREKIELTDIDELIVGVGPGSYTGVRIAVTIAKMIGYLNKITIKKVSSLALMASSVSSGFVLAGIDARRGNAFLGLFEVTDQSVIRKKTDCLENLEEYLKNLDLKPKLVFEGRPNIEKIIVSDLLETVADPATLVPNYLQVTEAERNKCQN